MSVTMISAGEVGPGVALLINDSGCYVLCSAGQAIEVDGHVLAEALARTRPVADLVARSDTPISGISARVERSLEHFGCAVERP